MAMRSDYIHLGGLTLLALVLSAQIALAQQDSSADRLPLAVGARWTYDFSTFMGGGVTHSYASDTGRAVYQVVGETQSADSVIWQLRRMADVQETTYGAPYHREIKDTTKFTLVEFTSGRHEIYAPAFGETNMFPFEESDADSSQFHRMGYVDGTNRWSGNLNMLDHGNPFPVWDYKYNLTLARDTGIVKIDGAHGTTGYYSRMRYDLRVYEKPDSLPHLEITGNTVSLTTIFGTEWDSTIILGNKGLGDVVVSGVVSTDPRLFVGGYASNIGPFARGFVVIQFNAPAADTVNADIIVLSNSVTSPDTIHVLAYAPGNTSLVPSGGASISCHIGQIGYDVITLTNNGNVQVHVDSVRSSSPTIWGHLSRIDIPANDWAVDTVFFAPDTLGDVWGWVTLYFNSRSTPLYIYMTGSVLPGPPPVPSAFALSQNYPNPFNPGTEIQYTIHDRQSTSLKIFDLLGREVALLVDEVMEPGTYSVTWNASGVASGVYFCRLQAGAFASTKKMILIR